MMDARSTDVERFRHAIARCLGLQFEDGRLGQLAEVLGRRMTATGTRGDAYLARLESECPAAEIDALAQELTVPETYFFRNADQFRALASVVLPERIAAQSIARRMRILSAGCASGEEPYSLAIAVRDLLDHTWDVSIVGLDVSSSALAKARAARFTPWSLRETPPDVQQRWFTQDGRDFVLAPAVQSMVRFEARNLLQDDPHLWQPESYDVIFFRNVLMYLTHADGHKVISRIARALKPGGYLFLGHAETLRGLSSDFHLRHTHDTFYYQRRDRLDRTSSESATPTSEAFVPAVVAAVETTDTWIEAIRRATERIHALTGPSATPAPAARHAGPGGAWDLGAARALLREERFAEAFESMQQLPPESARDPDVLLLRAALLTHRGRLAEAEDACRRLLEVDELSAGAHYLLALCREGAGDRTGALHHDRVAVYLDPSFAMPHLHLGLLARRSGDRAAAQRELEQALALLQREDASRLLLFGGGFGREMLLALCRTELTATAREMGRPS